MATDELYDVEPVAKKARHAEDELLWASRWGRIDQLKEMHDYTGPEVSFYFAWASFYTRYLRWAALFGVLATIFSYIDWYDDDVPPPSNASDVGSGEVGDMGSGGFDWFNVSNGTSTNDEANARVEGFLSAAYAVFMSIWATQFIEGWKRRSPAARTTPPRPFPLLSTARHHHPRLNARLLPTAGAPSGLRSTGTSSGRGRG